MNGRIVPCVNLRILGSEQEFVGASPFVGFLSMGLFVSHSLCDWRAMFAGLFRDSWSLSGQRELLDRPQPLAGGLPEPVGTTCRFLKSRSICQEILGLVNRSSCEDQQKELPIES